MNSKTAILVTQARQKLDTILGWFLALFFGLGGIGASIPAEGRKFDGSVLIVAVPLAALGVFLILKGRKTKKLVKTFKQYVSILAGDPENSLNTLAQSTNTSLDEVKKNLRMMIEKKFFANAVIDEKNQRLILRGTTDMQQIYQNSASVTQVVQKVAVNCPGCGAVNEVPKGSTGKCEYCGCTLQG